MKGSELKITKDIAILYLMKLWRQAIINRGGGPTPAMPGIGARIDIPILITGDLFWKRWAVKKIIRPKLPPIYRSEQFWNIPLPEPIRWQHLKPSSYSVIYVSICYVFLCKKRACFRKIQLIFYPNSWNTEYPPPNTNSLEVRKAR